MHKWAKSIMECVKSKVDAMGMDNLDRESVEELKSWTCIAEKVAEFDYYYHIVKAMEENPKEKYGETYDEHGKYYTQPRMDNGQFRHDMRRGYDEMYDVHDMMPMHSDRMYYDSGRNNGVNNATSTTIRGYSDSRYENARRGYEEVKKLNPDVEDMEKLEEVFKELKADMKELKPHMSTSAKTYARNELTTMANSMV